MFTINNTKNTADYEAESLPIISGMLILFSSSFQAFIGLCCEPCADALENLNKRDELWAYMKQTDRQLYNKLHHSVISRYMNLPGRTGRFLGKVAYRISRKVYGFN